MYKRYQGNTGFVRRVEEPREAPPTSPPLPPRPRPERAPKRPVLSPGKLLSGLRLETEDLLLLLILYLLYRESGDQDLLLIIGAMLLL